MTEKNKKTNTENQITRIMKPLSELNLLDRFLFDEVMEDEQTARDVLEIIFGKEIPLLSKNETEKEFRKSPQLRSIRIDVFSVDEGGTVYDTEMQKDDTGNLPKRSRFYQSHIDVSLMEPGIVDFNRLNDVYVIIIAPFDLWGFGRYRYTFRMNCEEETSLCLKDGAVRIFLNTHGTNTSEVSQELIDFLHYVENSTALDDGMKKNEKLLRIHDRVQKVKKNEEVGVRYMQKWEELAYVKAEGKTEGKAEAVLELLSEYGSVSDRLRKIILSQSDTDILNRWLKLAAKAESAEEFEKTLNGIKS